MGGIVGDSMHGTSLSLVVWQGWGVLSVLAVLTALLATVLAWLLPFPERSLNAQLACFDDRMALKDRLGAVPPFRAYLVTVHRFNEWLMEWFGPAFSGQAFEPFLAIAFIFPIALFLVPLLANGLNQNLVSAGEVVIFAAAFMVFAYVIVEAFRNLLDMIQQVWKRFGGDEGM